MKSPSSESSSSPMGVSSETVVWLMRRISRISHVGHAHLGGDLLRSGLAAHVLQQLALHPDELVDLLHHVHGDADGAGLVGDGPGDGLPDPPGGVGGELVSLAVVELLHRPDETQVALLDEVEEAHAVGVVALGDGDHQAQVGLGELVLGPDVAPLDALGQRHLLLGGEQLDPADLLEVHAHRIGGGNVDAQVELVDAAAPLELLARPSSSSSSSASSAGLVDHLDALVEQSGVHELDLLGGEIELGQHLGDVLGGDEPPPAAELDEPVDFFEVDDPAFRRRGPGQLPPPCPVRLDDAGLRAGRVVI